MMPFNVIWSVCITQLFIPCLYCASDVNSDGEADADYNANDTNADADADTDANPDVELANVNHPTPILNNELIINSPSRFSFSSIRRSSATSAHCMMCFSGFQNRTDTRFPSNLSCPLCRSAVADSNHPESSNSLRAEIGNLSSWRTSDAAAGYTSSGRRSFFVGSSFEYIVEDSVVPLSRTTRRETGSSSASPIFRETRREIVSSTASPIFRGTRRELGSSTASPFRSTSQQVFAESTNTGSNGQLDNGSEQEFVRDPGINERRRSTRTNSRFRDFA